MNRNLEKIMKKEFRGINKNKFINEINLVETLNYTMPEYQVYRGHNVVQDGVDCISFIAKEINKYKNQTGAGNYRHLVKNGKYLGLYEHKNDGGYRLVA